MVRTLYQNIKTIFKEEDIIYQGLTGSLLINIEEPKDQDYLLVVKNNFDIHKVMINNEQSKVKEYYVFTLNTITDFLFETSLPLKAISLFCSLPDTIYESLDLDSIILKNTIIQHTQNFIQNELDKLQEQRTMSVMYNTSRERKDELAKETIKFKHIYYFPLLKHILETNNHNYTEEELVLARKFYYKEATNEEYQDIFNYFDMVFDNSLLG